jgi:ribulose-5-phosphate 4-epimerase/fuculose-1-phosphate aldolase
MSRMPASTEAFATPRRLSFALSGPPAEGRLAWLARGITRVMERHGHPYEPPHPGVGVVFHFVDPASPRPFRRRSQATFVVAVCEWPEVPADPLKAHYPLLVRSLANLLVCLLPTWPACVQFVTLERGHYLEFMESDEEDFFARIYRRVHPLASSRLVVDNRFEPDLEPELWDGDELTRQMGRAGRELAAMGLLPAPFPLRELLSPSDLRHLRRLFGLGGLSYGNLSARKDATRFWMSASGVDKSRLRTVGRDILMVKGYDPVANAMVLSVPPGIRPRRVSVDAIEHWMIYREHPSVGAIVHVHAWMAGIEATQVNYPCGTYELAFAVAELVRRAPDPACAVVGLRNHGVTVTGRSLPEIMDRIRDRLLPEVPMA